MNKTKITNEQRLLLQNWLDKQSKKVAKENNTSEKSKLNNQYVGVIKFIESVGGSVIYKAKHSHRLYLETIPESLDFKSFNPSDYQLFGVLSFLLSAGIIIETNLGGKADEENI